MILQQGDSNLISLSVIPMLKRELITPRCTPLLVQAAKYFPFFPGIIFLFSFIFIFLQPSRIHVRKTLFWISAEIFAHNFRQKISGFQMSNSSFLFYIITIMLYWKSSCIQSSFAENTCQLQSRKIFPLWIQCIHLFMRPISLKLRYLF